MHRCRAIRELYQVRTASSALAARLAAERGRPRIDLSQRRRRSGHSRKAEAAPEHRSYLIQADLPFTPRCTACRKSRIEDTVAAASGPHQTLMGIVLDDPKQRPLVWHEHAEIMRLVLAAMPSEPKARRGTTPTVPARKTHEGSPIRRISGMEIAMELTAPQLRQFAEEGWLFLPDCFSEAEVAALRDEAEQIYAPIPGGVARENRGAAHGVRRAHL